MILGTTALVSGQSALIELICSVGFRSVGFAIRLSEIKAK